MAENDVNIAKSGQTRVFVQYEGSSPAAGYIIYCSDCTATDSSTGVQQVYNGSTWKNAW